MRLVALAVLCATLWGCPAGQIPETREPFNSSRGR